MERLDGVWKSAIIAKVFLEGMRGAIPLALEQIDVMLRVIRAAKPHLGSFLDLGCGDGILGKAILGQYPTALGVFLDFSEPMIEAARTNLNNHDDRAAFVMQDYGTPAWATAVSPRAPFDAVVSGYSIHHQPDHRKKELYGEIHDMLAPDGEFVNIEYVASASQWVEDLFDELFVDAIYAFYQRGGKSKSRGTIADEFHNRPHKEANILAPLAAQCDWLREIGYVHVDCYLKVFELAVFGGQRLD